jgi:hypothetical protein
LVHGNARHSGTPAPGHVVVIHIESFTHDSVRVHLSSNPFGIQVRGDTGVFPKGEVTVTTPVDVTIGAEVMALQLSTLDNKAVRVLFTNGATETEKQLHAWGRLLSFKRDRDGNLQTETKVIPADPTRSERR